MRAQVALKVRLVASAVRERLDLVFGFAVTVATVTALTTLAMCYRFKHLSRGVYFPKISATGSPYPEHYLYATGFAASSFALAVGFWELHTAVLPRLFCGGEWEGVMNTWGLRAGLLSCAGMFVQGLFGGRPECRPSFVMHTIGSSTFFFAGGAYMTLVALLLRKSARIPLGGGSGGFVAQSRSAKYTLVWVYWSFGAVFAVCYVFFKQYVVGYFFTALSEWVTAFAYLLFIASYVPDMRRIQASSQQSVDIIIEEDSHETIIVKDETAFGE